MAILDALTRTLGTGRHRSGAPSGTGTLGASREVPAVAGQSGIQTPQQRASTLPGNYLTAIIEQADARAERSRDGGTKGLMHVSSLIKLDCERRSTLMATHQIEGYEKVTTGHRIMWAQGRATETHIRDAILHVTSGNMAYGAWTCACKRSVHHGLRPNLSCPTCQTPLTTYGEPKLVDNEVDMTGSPDLTLLITNRLLVTEIKSMTPDQFDDLERPIPDHSHQGLMYREMLRRRGFNVMDSVAVVYARKQFKWGGRGITYKEYHVDATLPQHETMVADVYALAARIKRFRETRTLPERTACATPQSTKAKKCPVAHLCFESR